MARQGRAPARARPCCRSSRRSGRWRRSSGCAERQALRAGADAGDGRAAARQVHVLADLCRRRAPRLHGRHPRRLAATTTPLTGSGWPTYYLEDYAAQSLGFHTQLGSLICEGVFVKYPKLKVVLIESGVTWLPPYLWRLSKFWRGVRNEVPWIDRSPEEFVRDHIRLTIQPFDAPPVGGAHWANHGPAAVRRDAALLDRFSALAVRRRRDAARRPIARRCAARS